MAKNKKPQGFAALVEKGFKDKIQVRTTKGGAKQVSRLEVMVRQQVNAAVKGEISALKFVLKYLSDGPPGPSTQFMVEYISTDGSSELRYPSGRIKRVDAQGKVTWTHRKRPKAH